MNPALLDALDALMDAAGAGCTHPLDALETLQLLTQATDNLTDHVIGQALTGGHSRREIAQALGVTRQAVQQRAARIALDTADEEQTA